MLTNDRISIAAIHQELRGVQKDFRDSLKNEPPKISLAVLSLHQRINYKGWLQLVTSRESDKNNAPHKYALNYRTNNSPVPFVLCMREIRHAGEIPNFFKSI